MIKVICVNNEEVENQLKLNLEYEVEEANETQYKMKLGNGVIGTYNKNRFKEV